MASSSKPTRKTTVCSSRAETHAVPSSGQGQASAGQIAKSASAGHAPKSANAGARQVPRGSLGYQAIHDQNDPGSQDSRLA
jgi:hypothetical protein